MLFALRPDAVEVGGVRRRCSRPRCCPWRCRCPCRREAGRGRWRRGWCRCPCCRRRCRRRPGRSGAELLERHRGVGRDGHRARPRLWLLGIGRPERCLVLAALPLTVTVTYLTYFARAKNWRSRTAGGACSIGCCVNRWGAPCGRAVAPSRACLTGSGEPRPCPIQPIPGYPLSLGPATSGHAPRPTRAGASRRELHGPRATSPRRDHRSHAGRAGALETAGVARNSRRPGSPAVVSWWSPIRLRHLLGDPEVRQPAAVISRLGNDA
jgi:hypothetical protein